MIVKIERAQGTHRTWQREVGYGVPPEWYLEPMKIELEIGIKNETLGKS